MNNLEAIIVGINEAQIKVKRSWRASKAGVKFMRHLKDEAGNYFFTPRDPDRVESQDYFLGYPIEVDEGVGAQIHFYQTLQSNMECHPKSYIKTFIF